MGEMKDAKCVSCGRDIQITKFGSLKTCKCDECKNENKPINESIVNTTVVSKSSQVKMVGDMKQAVCCVCGKETLITKFGSLATAKCDDCKGVKRSATSNMDDDYIESIKIDRSKIDMSKVGNINDYFILDSVIKNPRLRKLRCPGCGHEYMHILKVLDWSIFGVVVNYQCHECYLMVNISEQCDHIVAPCKEHIIYNYSGDVVKETISSIKDTKLKNTINYLYDLCVSNNIDIQGLEVPKYLRKIDIKNDVGLNTDKEILRLEQIKDEGVLHNEQD